MTLKDRIYEMFGDDVNMEELMRQLGKSRTTLRAAWKREEQRGVGRHNIDSDTALAIRRLSGRSLSWILTGEEDAPRTADQQLATARKVASRLAQQTGLSAAEARAIVGRLALDESVRWDDEIALYHRALDAAGLISVGASTATALPTPAAPKQLPPQALLRVRKKVAARRKT